MIVVSLAVLSIGLILGVYAMLYGTERLSAHGLSVGPSPLFNRATFAACCVGFGLSAYLLASKTSLSTISQLAIALAIAAAAFGVLTLLIAKWAIPGARSDHIDERYALQGTLAQITTDIPEFGVGMLRYSLDDGTFELPARDINGGVLTAGTDVVIDRIENGVAFAESWAHVEERL